MDRIIGTKKIAQVGYIVKDIETSKKIWAAFLCVEEPPTVACGDYTITQTTYKGKPAPKANSLLTFFDMTDGIQIELIQPNEYPSTWRDFLDTKGEGMHHIAFQVDNSEKVIAAAKEFGIEVVQQGTYGDGSGKYTYLEGSEKLKCVVELLESFEPIKKTV